MHDWPWLETQETIQTTPGQDSYVPGATQTPPYNGWYRTIEIRDSYARVIERWSITELDDRWNSDWAGRPRDWAIYGDKIIFRPVPDANYDILHRYIYMEPDLINDTDTPVMPMIHHFAIVELATFLALRRDRNDARAAVAFDAYEQWVNEQLKRALRRADLPGRVRVRPGGWVPGL
ncbi:MAG: hypothetical protein ACRD22_12700 [Terriglobia bacterium]